MRRLFVAFLLLALSASQALSHGVVPSPRAGEDGASAIALTVVGGANKRVCWRKVLVPARHGDRQAVSFSSCSPDHKLIRAVVLPQPDMSSPVRRTASSPHLSPHDPGRPLRPPIA
ncbi:MAG: hypothetical protein WAU86_19850 [Oricola sp.]